MCDEEAFVEELAAKATRDQQAGREKAERVREEALDAIKVHKAGGGSDEEEAIKAVAIAVQASVDAKAAEATFTAALVELSANHRATRAEVNEQRAAPGPRSIERSHAADQAEGVMQSREPSWKCRSEPRTRGTARQSRKRTCITTP